MINALVKLKSNGPYSQSKFHQTEKLDKELPHAFEERTWRNRMHCNAAGNVFIPPLAFKNCLSEAAKYLGVKIPGKGNEKFVKHFEAGVLVLEGIDLGVKWADVDGEWLFVPSDGKRGGSKRVLKKFGNIPSWSGEVTFHILDETITKDVFEAHLVQAGLFIGLGRARPRNNGTYGRFTVESVQWQPVTSWKSMSK